MTLKNNRTPLLSNIKLHASLHHHMWIQTGVRVRKRLSWVMTSMTLTFDLWPWPFVRTSLLSLVITPENLVMIQWQEHLLYILYRLLWVKYRFRTLTKLLSTIEWGQSGGHFRSYLGDNQHRVKDSLAWGQCIKKGITTYFPKCSHSICRNLKWLMLTHKTTSDEK